MKKQVTETMKLALNRWPFVLQTLGITVPVNGRHGACPACGGKDRTIKTGAGRGSVIIAAVVMVLTWSVG